MKSTVYFAKWILLPDGNLLHNGGLVVTGSTITSIGQRSSLKRSAQDRMVNLGECLLLPGLINMHTHLEEGVMRGIDIEQPHSFSTWLMKRDSSLKNAKEEQIRSAIKLCIRESLANGITTIVDSSRTAMSESVLVDEPIRSWVFYESHPTDEQSESDALSVIRDRIDQSSGVIGIGVSPYAFFSLAPSTHESLVSFAHRSRYLWACHISESAEELQAFSEQSGDLYFFITKKKPWPFTESGHGPLRYAISRNCIPDNSILFHCNYISSEELTLLAAKHVSIVCCSQYTAMFGHKPLPVEVALKRGIHLCLGTESPLSLNSISLFDELFHLRSLYPHIPAKEMLRWVTSNPAKALKCYDQIGSLAVGKKADIIGVRFSFSHGHNQDILEEMLMEEPQIVFVMVNGEEVIVE